MSKHLTAAERGKIEVLHQSNFTLSEIARKVGKHKTTIWRELQRASPTGYWAHFAQIDYEDKREYCLAVKKLDSSVLRDFLITALTTGWSPEAIAGRLKLEKNISISVETIYKFIYEDEYFKKHKISQYLKRGHKVRRRKWGRKRQKSKIPNRVSISKRPEIVMKRKEMGHWEGDSVIYPNLKAVNTLVELKSGLAVFTKLYRKQAKLTAQAMSEAMLLHGGKTITVDNGSEFTAHEDVTAKSGVKVYFADPYSSWQRGANENLNGLLRAYLPKRMNIDDLTQAELAEIAEDLNNRPRKRLGWRTPNEIFYNRTDTLISFYRCI